MKLLCHNLTVTDVTVLEIEALELESDQLVSIANALNGKSLHEVFLNGVGDGRLLKGVGLVRCAQNVDR